MLVTYSIFVLSNIICLVQSYLVLPSTHRRIQTDTKSPVQDINKDAGDPLFLTPFIRKGEIEEGKKLARVSLTDELNITSYSGYITVNEQYDSNMFFWYFPAMEADLKAPVVVWLQGGPGGSSMFGLFEENGPLKIEDGKIMKRDINWATNHHLIYIDNPVGTGFSFTNDSKGYCTDQVQIGDELHNMLVQFFKLFPEIQNNDFFITGESYAGKYIPALGYAIHKKNPTSEVKINLKGLAIGDGSVDPINMLVLDKYLYQLGLIDWNTAENMRQLQNAVKNLVLEKRYNEAYYSYSQILRYVPISNMYNYLQLWPYNTNYIDPTLNKPEVQKAIHVGSRYFNSFNNEVYGKLVPDWMKSVAPWLIELLDHYQVLTYNGQLDIILAYPLTINYLRKLNFTGAEEYKTAKRHEWMVEGEVAGFVKQAGRLTEVMVRNAGHMVPFDQPKWAWDLVTRFTHGKPFY